MAEDIIKLYPPVIDDHDSESLITWTEQQLEVQAS